MFEAFLSGANLNYGRRRTRSKRPNDCVRREFGLFGQDRNEGRMLDMRAPCPENPGPAASAAAKHADAADGGRQIGSQRHHSRRRDKDTPLPALLDSSGSR